MFNITRLPLCLFAVTLLAELIPVSAADPAKVDTDYAFQGEYAGVLAGQYDVGSQVIALGDGKFKLVLFPGGLPVPPHLPEHLTRLRGPLQLLPWIHLPIAATFRPDCYEP